MFRLLPLALVCVVCSSVPRACAQFWQEESFAIVEEHDPREDAEMARRLQKMGMSGLQTLLDDLLPDTAEPKKVTVSEATIRQWIDRLGDDRFAVRETASRQLAELGTGASPFLVRAAQSKDPETAWRAACILRQWDSGKYLDRTASIGVFQIYCSSLRDEAMLRELARRTAMALGAGVYTDSRHTILSRAAVALVQSGNDQYTEPLVPLLKHADLDVAMLVANAAAEGAVQSSRGKCPRLLIESLRSPRTEVVQSALNHSYAFHVLKRDTEFQEALMNVFRTATPSLKIAVAGPLTQVFGVAEARRYLLSQLTVDYSDQCMAALSLVACQEHPGIEPDDELLGALRPLLKSRDASIRTSAAYTLATYGGEKVVRSLMPLLGQEDMDVSHCLLQQADRKMLRRVLAEAAASKDNNSKARAAANKLLKHLDKPDSDGSDFDVIEPEQ
ncbi:MAG: HEAT repeat domain-containing protein [Planctomycetota bacterium]